jgi:hypothetical protein
VLRQASYAALEQAIADAQREWLVSAPLLGMALQAYGISEANAVRLLLPGHVYKEHHTLAQAMLPRAILGALDSTTTHSSLEDVGNDVMQYPVFLGALQDAIIEVGKRLADPVATSA